MEKIFSQAVDTLFKRPVLLLLMAFSATSSMIFAGKIFIDFWKSTFDIHYFTDRDFTWMIYAVILLFLVYVFFLLMEGLLIYDVMLKGDVEIKKILLRSVKEFPLFLQHVFLIPFFTVVATIYYLKGGRGIEYSIGIEVRY
jgi:hypothetical protein